jgi:hypothetical protein
MAALEIVLVDQSRSLDREFKKVRSIYEPAEQADADDRIWRWGFETKAVEGNVLPGREMLDAICPAALFASKNHLSQPIELRTALIHSAAEM